MKTPQIGGFYNTSLPDPILRYERVTNRFVLMGDYVTPEYTVPKGEYTDGASRPEFINLLVKKYDRHLPACIVHDWMYRSAIATKDAADDLFMQSEKMRHWIRGLAYVSCRNVWWKRSL